jgi:hypothetical protein
MLVPVYGDFGKGWIRIGQARVIGNSTRTGDVTLATAPKKIGINIFKEILER